MPEKVRIASITDVPAGTATELTAAGRVIALYNVDGQFFALDGVCPHAGGPLGNGSLEGNIVTCPWHGWQFDVSSGQHCLNANLQHTTYNVSVVGNDVFIEFP